tara:strand:- start:2146 stop:6645 length:4500 start_codon:yes stop_codon:yes gene_type:complete
MAGVVKQQYRSSIGNIGIARQSQAGQITAEAIVRGADTFSGILFERAEADAKQAGAEMAQSASTQDIYGIDENGQRDPLRALKDGNFFTMGGRIQQEAYKNVVTQRFNNKVELDMRDNSARISTEVMGLFNPAVEFERRFSDYISKVGNSVDAPYKSFVTDTGSLWLSQRRASLAEQQKRKQLADIKAAALKRHQENLETALTLGASGEAVFPSMVSNQNQSIDTSSYLATGDTGGSNEVEIINNAIIASKGKAREVDLHFMSGKFMGRVARFSGKDADIRSSNFISAIATLTTSGFDETVLEASGLPEEDIQFLKDSFAQMPNATISEISKLIKRVKPTAEAVSNRATVAAEALRRQDVVASKETAASYKEVLGMLQRNVADNLAFEGPLKESFDFLSSAQDNLTDFAGDKNINSSQVAIYQSNLEKYENQVGERIILEQLVKLGQVDEATLSKISQALNGTNKKTDLENLGFEFPNSLDNYGLWDKVEITPKVTDALSGIKNYNKAIAAHEVKVRQSFNDLYLDNRLNDIINAHGTIVFPDEVGGGVISQANFNARNLESDLDKNGILDATAQSKIDSAVAENRIYTLFPPDISLAALIDVKSIVANLAGSQKQSYKEYSALGLGSDQSLDAVINILSGVDQARAKTIVNDLISAKKAGIASSDARMARLRTGINEKVTDFLFTASSSLEGKLDFAGVASVQGLVDIVIKDKEFPVFDDGSFPPSLRNQQRQLHDANKNIVETLKADAAKLLPEDLKKFREEFSKAVSLKKGRILVNKIIRHPLGEARTGSLKDSLEQLKSLRAFLAVEGVAINESGVRLDVIAVLDGIINNSVDKEKLKSSLKESVNQSVKFIEERIADQEEFLKQSSAYTAGGDLLVSPAEASKIIRDKYKLGPDWVAQSEAILNSKEGDELFPQKEGVLATIRVRGKYINTDIVNSMRSFLNETASVGVTSLTPTQFSRLYENYAETINSNGKPAASAVLSKFFTTDEIAIMTTLQLAESSGATDQVLSDLRIAEKMELNATDRKKLEGGLAAFYDPQIVSESVFDFNSFNAELEGFVGSDLWNKSSPEFKQGIRDYAKSLYIMSTRTNAMTLDKASQAITDFANQSHFVSPESIDTVYHGSTTTSANVRTVFGEDEAVQSAIAELVATLVSQVHANPGELTDPSNKNFILPLHDIADVDEDFKLGQPNKTALTKKSRNYLDRQNNDKDFRRREFYLAANPDAKVGSGSLTLYISDLQGGVIPYTGKDGNRIIISTRESEHMDFINDWVSNRTTLLADRQKIEVEANNALEAEILSDFVNEPDNLDRLPVLIEDITNLRYYQNDESKVQDIIDGANLTINQRRDLDAQVATNLYERNNNNVEYGAGVVLEKLRQNGFMITNVGQIDSLISTFNLQPDVAAKVKEQVESRYEELGIEKKIMTQWELTKYLKDVGQRFPFVYAEETATQPAILINYYRTSDGKFYAGKNKAAEQLTPHMVRRLNSAYDLFMGINDE